MMMLRPSSDPLQQTIQAVHRTAKIAAPNFNIRLDFDIWLDFDILDFDILGFPVIATLQQVSCDARPGRHRLP
jgi:hypothetical protein